MKPFFFGKIIDGRVKLDRADAFREYVAKFKNGATIEMTIDLRKDTRSDNQNRYYWGVVIQILSDHFGYFPEDMHEALKLKFLLQDIKPFPAVKSTAKMKTDEFEDYLDKVRMWAMAEFEINIPLPNEVEFDL